MNYSRLSLIGTQGDRLDMFVISGIRINGVTCMQRSVKLNDLNYCCQHIALDHFEILPDHSVQSFAFFHSTQSIYY